MDPVLTDERVDRQERCGAKRVLVSGREVECDGLLALVLTELV